MNKKLLSACLALALGGGAGYATSVLAQAKPDVLVKQRQAAMTLIGKYWGPTNAMAQGKTPYNAEVATRNAAFLEALSQMPWDGFHPSTRDEKSRALPAVYDNADGFKQAADRLRASATKLAAAANDEGAFKSAAAEMGKSCGACHKEFRSK